jgi:hypothetical protein
MEVEQACDEPEAKALEGRRRAFHWSREEDRADKNGGKARAMREGIATGLPGAGLGGPGLLFLLFLLLHHLDAGIILCAVG